MKVMKFGGTSVGSASSILNVKKIVESAGEPVIVVVSALGGVTDRLIETSKKAAAGDASYEDGFRDIVRRHVDMVRAVIPSGQAQEADTAAAFDDELQGLLGNKAKAAVLITRVASARRERAVGASEFERRHFAAAEREAVAVPRGLVREARKSEPQQQSEDGFRPGGAEHFHGGDVERVGERGARRDRAAV